MNILFCGLRTSQESVGVMKKLKSQIAAFESLGHSVWATDIDDEGGWLLHENKRIKLRDKKEYVPKGLSAHLNHAYTFLAAAKYTDVDFDLCYIRKPLCDSLHLRALRQLKKRNVVIAEEIPTWPYDAELESENTVASKIFLSIDRMYRKKLYKYLDFFTTYSYDENILGVPAISLANAVDVSTIPKRISPQKTDTLRLFCVSSMFFWHGYDRLIKGMAEYKSTEGAQKVVLDIVGDGPEHKAWQALAKELGLQDDVHFHGTKTGEPLADIIAKSDVAVASLGWYRKGMSVGFELKIREYIARGIPFVYACEDIAAKDVAQCCLLFSNDDTPIDISKVVEFAQGISADECAEYLQEYAKKYLRWETQMQKVIDKASEK